MTEDQRHDQRIRLKCLSLVMECGAEVDRRDPYKKAEELLKWVTRETDKVPGKEEKTDGH